MNINIRKAKFEDLREIYQLVKELAIYEKAEDAVTATLEDYENDYQSGLFESLIAVSNGQVIGMMIYYMTYSTWKGKMLYLEDFVVKDTYRNKGIGQQLFDAYMEIASKKGAKLVKWQVLDWNKPAIQFYEKNKAIIEKEWYNVKIFLP